MIDLWFVLIFQFSLTKKKTIIYSCFTYIHYKCKFNLVHYANNRIEYRREDAIQMDDTSIPNYTLPMKKLWLLRSKTSNRRWYILSNLPHNSSMSNGENIRSVSRMRTYRCCCCWFLEVTIRDGCHPLKCTMSKVL